MSSARLKTFAIVVLVVAMTGRATQGQSSSGSAKKMKAAAIQVMMIESSEIKLPAEFQVSLYEDLIAQLEKKSGLTAYREGDRKANTTADLVILRATVTGFKEGSERKRQVTTVAGATSIVVHCTFTDASGKTLLEQDIQGKVRFFGGNLRATYDFAKKTAQLAHDHFSPNAAA